jgi:hypothetical protein
MSDHVRMITLIAITGGLMVVGALANKYGVDTRPGFDERRRPLS